MSFRAERARELRHLLADVCRAQVQLRMPQFRVTAWHHDGLLAGAGTLALRGQWLAQPKMVTAGIADGGVTDAIGLVDGFLEDLRPGGA